ncbi:MAG: phosphinothricin acetyltransferase [Rhodocyclales bacterium]|nr:phosphinothricin acetyltransferase [Rhodocyclales bacterium]
MQIRPFVPRDELGISEIYNDYVTETIVTFEEEPLSSKQMRDRIDSYLGHYPWFVCELDGQIVGYSYAGKFHQRAAYRHTTEVTVYVRRGFERRGIGRALYEPLFARLAGEGCHVALAAIALPNQGSVGLHEAYGFTKVAHFSEVGKKFGEWIDVGYWQKRFA